MEPPTILNLDAVTRSFQPGQVKAVDNVSLTLQKGELLALLGPSGCGKTTLLRLIAGLERPDGGRVDIAGRPVAGDGHWLPPEDRQLGMVFQDYALFPHLSVADNVSFGLKGTKGARRRSATQMRDRVAQSIDLVRLSGLDKRYPHELSGGQQQRVALSRALAPDPALVLLDEPLSNLDAQVRQSLREEVRSILKASGASGVFVTHDCEEAMAIADKVAVMRQGRIEQLDRPEVLYWQPVSRFVAAFVAQMNFIRARRGEQDWETELGKFSGRVTGNIEVSALPSTREVTLGVRQSNLHLDPESSDRPGNARVLSRQFLGREYRYTLELRPHPQFPSSDTVQTLQALTPVGDRFEIGDTVNVSIGGQPLRVFAE
ncbi:MAG: ABC transporter ATP-binding protein [Cyanobacteria bacterium P01_D01_bin.73]